MKNVWGKIGLTGSMLAMLLCVTACGQQVEDQGGTTDDGTISGEITVLTNRTDRVDTTFVEYVERFNEKYPDVEVKFEGITDYQGVVQVRLNSKDYGDVLLIPTVTKLDDLSNFFEPLGTMEEMGAKYQIVDEKAYDGQVYGVPTMINTSGILYNKAVFEKAGVSEIPTTPEEFLAAMQAVKDNTDAIPYYTNYAAGWTLDQWENHRISVSGDSEFANKMPHVESPFAQGEPHYVVYKLLHDLVAQELVEKDPMTADWELSKQMIADGEIGAMVLGSWAISQITALAENPDDIGYMPFPHQIDGKFNVPCAGDHNIGINKHSENKEAARAFLDFFLEESGYATDEGAIEPTIGSSMPSTLSVFEELGVNLVNNAPATPGEEGLINQVDGESEVGLWAPAFKQSIIESALGTTNKTYDDIMNDLNDRWQAARESLGVE